MALKNRNSTSHTGDPVLFYDLTNFGDVLAGDLSSNVAPKNRKRQSVRLLETY